MILIIRYCTRSGQKKFRETFYFSKVNTYRVLSLAMDFDNRENAKQIFTVFFIVVLDFVLSPRRCELLHGTGQSVFFFFDIVVVRL